MSKFTSPLDGVRVAAPCSADWERMRGDERVRFCAECSLNVYNLSAMTRREAEALIASAEGRLCVRYFRRADGTILTRNCPVGLRAVKRRIAGVARAAASAALSFVAGVAAFAGLSALNPYGGEEMGEYALPAPAQPDLIGTGTKPHSVPAEPLELFSGGMDVEPAEAWMEGKAEIPDRPGEMMGKVSPLRRKAKGR
jgi:hypothetical protein